MPALKRLRLLSRRIMRMMRRCSCKLPWLLAHRVLGKHFCISCTVTGRIGLQRQKRRRRTCLLVTVTVNGQDSTTCVGKVTVPLATLIEEDIDPPVSSVGPAELPEPVEGSRESDWEDVAAHGTRETLGVLSSLACGVAGLSDRAEGFWAIYVRCTTLRSVWFTCTGSLLPRGAEGSGLGEATGG